MRTLLGVAVAAALGLLLGRGGLRAAAPAPVAPPVAAVEPGAASGLLARCVSLAGRALLASLVVVLVALMAGSMTGRLETAVALSGSMSPTFSAGDMLIETPQATDSLRVGEIITYHMPIGDHHVESHRIVWVRHTRAATLVRTRGDANSVADPWTARLPGRETWHVRETVPAVGRIVPLLNRPLTRLLAILALVLFPVGLLLGRIWQPAEPV